MSHAVRGDITRNHLKLQECRSQKPTQIYSINRMAAIEARHFSNRDKSSFLKQSVLTAKGV